MSEQGTAVVPDDCKHCHTRAAAKNCGGLCHACKTWRTRHGELPPAERAVRRDERECKGCGERFTYEYRGGRLRLYCDPCKGSAANGGRPSFRPIVPCPTCGASKRGSASRQCRTCRTIRRLEEAEMRANLARPCIRCSATITTVAGAYCADCRPVMSQYLAASEGWANDPTIDHLIPVSKGGLHRWNNVKAAHHHCNSERRDAPLPELLDEWDLFGVVA